MVRPEYGDIVAFRRGSYTHTAIFLGKPADFREHIKQSGITGLQEGTNYVIHFTGSMVRARVSASSRSSRNFSGLGDNGIGVSPYKDELEHGNTSVCVVHMGGQWGTTSYTAKEAVRRAFSYYRSGDYDVLFNNCQHFVTWAKYGRGMWLTSQAGTAFVAGGAAGMTCFGLSAVFPPAAPLFVPLGAVLSGGSMALGAANLGSMMSSAVSPLGSDDDEE